MEGNILLSFPDELGLIFTSKSCGFFFLNLEIKKLSGQLGFDCYHERLNFQPDIYVLLNVTINIAKKVRFLHSLFRDGPNFRTSQECFLTHI